MLSVELQAVADVSKLLPSYDSREEEWFAAHGPLLLANELGPVAWWSDHVLTWKVPGGSYKPDFLVIFADGRIANLEVKGATERKSYRGRGHRLQTRTPNARDARSKIRAAAALYPWCLWIECRVNARTNDWELEIIEPGR